MRTQLEECLFCEDKFQSKDMWWASLPTDGDEDNFWCCDKCAVNEGLDEGNGNEEHGDWSRPGTRGDF